MPGHIGTSIAINSGRIMRSGDHTPEELAQMRERFAALGLLDETVTDDQLREIVAGIGRSFRDNAPMTAEQAATIILDGVREERWRILVGDDAHRLDEMVRENPEEAYSEGFLAKLRERVEWNLG